MAVEVFYGLPSLQSGTDFLAMQQGGTAPTGATFSPATGFRGASTSTAPTVNHTSEMWSETTRAVASFDATAKPGAPDNTNGNAFRTPAAKTGNYPSGNWTITLDTIAITTGFNGRFRYDVRVYRSTSATGSSPTEITASTLTTTATAANVLVDNHIALSVTWAAPSITLSSEYLFFTVALEITSVPTVAATNRDLILYQGTGTSVTTTNFSAGGLVEYVGMIPI